MVQTLVSQIRQAPGPVFRMVEKSLILCILLIGIETYCVLVEKVVYRVKSMMNVNNYDIVKASWLLKCIDAGHFIPW